MRDNIKKLLATSVLLSVGCLQMLGNILGIDKLEAVGFATCASPKQKVFTTQNGYETFSADFSIGYKDKNQQAHDIQITPENYKNIKGPYNRRNMYGAGLSYAPVLSNNDKTKELFESVIKYALCNNAPIIKELGIDDIDRESEIIISLKPKKQNMDESNWKLIYEVTCHE